MKTAEIPAKKPITIKFQRTAIFGYVGLLILMPLWMFVFSPREGHSNGFIFAVYILPLLFPLKGIIQDKAYTYAWANFIVMLYFRLNYNLNTKNTKNALISAFFIYASLSPIYGEQPHYIGSALPNGQTHCCKFNLER